MSNLPKPKEEDIIVDGCTCGKSRLLMVKQRYYSCDTSDQKRTGTMRDYGLAWVDLLDGYVLEIDGTNDTNRYRRPATLIIKQIPLTKDAKEKRITRLEYLARSHPGLYEVIRVIAEKEGIEPIEIPLMRLAVRAEKKRLAGLRRERERKQRDVEELDKEIKKAEGG